jgi:hypothetical protein
MENRELKCFNLKKKIQKQRNCIENTLLHGICTDVAPSWKRYVGTRYGTSSFTVFHTEKEKIMKTPSIMASKEKLGLSAP